MPAPAPPQAHVVVYGRRSCPYCRGAMELLRDKDAAFEEVDVRGRSDLRQWMASACQQHTVPQVFINGVCVGGYEDLLELDREGRLDALLAEAPSVDKQSVRF